MSRACHCMDCRVRRADFILSALADPHILEYVSRKVGLPEETVRINAASLARVSYPSPEAIEEILVEAGLDDNPRPLPPVDIAVRYHPAFLPLFAWEGNTSDLGDDT